jgi:hypothetical protein
MYTPEFDTEQEAIDYLQENGCDDFDGMNCNDYKDDSEDSCGGWDGTSRRCYCGNRRVAIVTATALDKWVAYGEAY